MDNKDTTGNSTTMEENIRTEEIEEPTMEEIYGLYMRYYNLYNQADLVNIYEERNNQEYQRQQNIFKEIAQHAETLDTLIYKRNDGIRLTQEDIDLFNSVKSAANYIHEDIQELLKD